MVAIKKDLNAGEDIADLNERKGQLQGEVDNGQDDAAGSKAAEIANITEQVSALEGQRITNEGIIEALTNESSVKNAVALTIESTIANIEATIRLNE
jgi:hypothetical protein